MKKFKNFIILMFSISALNFTSYNIANSAEIITIKANEGRLYFGGLFQVIFFICKEVFLKIQNQHG